MAKIAPFCGIRYSQDKITDISDVVTQPYDRIGPKEQDIYYQRSPYNVCRIIKGKPEEGDNGGNVYTRAGGHLRTWLEKEVLKKDAEPSLYVYHQAYSFAGEQLVRKGFVAMGALEPDKVHAHEKTLKGPKEDRLKLMRATEANFGHIFMLYSDPSRRADRLLDAAIEGSRPIAEAKDDFGNLHTVWSVSESSTIRGVQQSLADKDLYIADGHHRYETAANFMLECRKKGWKATSSTSFDHRMMTLCNINEPGMSIRPIHRLVHALPQFDPESFLRHAKRDFLVSEYRDLNEMEKAVSASREEHTFGCYARGIYSTLTLRDESLLDEVITEDRSADWKRLDVSILHNLILERLLGIDTRALEEQKNVTYTRDPSEAVSKVDSGEEQAFFLLNSTSPEQVRRVADHGEKMPQKSTDFYPKLLTGLVLARLEIEKPTA